jgi:hypothetical protein
MSTKKKVKRKSPRSVKRIRKKSIRKKSIRKKSIRKKSIRKKSIRKKSIRKKSIRKQVGGNKKFTLFMKTIPGQDAQNGLLISLNNTLLVIYVSGVEAIQQALDEYNDDMFKNIPFKIEGNNIIMDYNVEVAVSSAFMVVVKHIHINDSENSYEYKAVGEDDVINFSKNPDVLKYVGYAQLTISEAEKRAQEWYDVLSNRRFPEQQRYGAQHDSSRGFDAQAERFIRAWYTFIILNDTFPVNFQESSFFKETEATVLKWTDGFNFEESQDDRYETLSKLLNFYNKYEKYLMFPKFDELHAFRAENSMYSGPSFDNTPQPLRSDLALSLTYDCAVYFPDPKRFVMADSDLKIFPILLFNDSVECEILLLGGIYIKYNYNDYAADKPHQVYKLTPDNVEEHLKTAQAAHTQSKGMLPGLQEIEQLQKNLSSFDTNLSEILGRGHDSYPNLIYINNNFNKLNKRSISDLKRVARTLNITINRDDDKTALINKIKPHFTKEQYQVYKNFYK